MSNPTPSTPNGEASQSGATEKNRMRYALEGAMALAALWVALWWACDLPPREPPRDLPLAARIQLTARPADGEVELKWSVFDAPQNITNWEYQSRLAGGSYGAWKDVDTDGTSEGQTVEGLTNGLIYAFRVKFTNSYGDDILSNEAIALPALHEVVEAETPRARFCTGDQLGIVDFARGRHRISLDYLSNRVSLANVVSGIDDRVGNAAPVLVAGYASGTGEPAYNLNLSQRRADAVATYLRNSVRSPNVRLVTMAMGERHAEPVPDRENERYQKVVVTACGSESEATEN